MQEIERKVAAEVLSKMYRDGKIPKSDLNVKDNKLPTLVPFMHYVTAKIDGKTVKFIDNKAKKVGMQSFDKNGLPTGKPFMIASIAMLYGKVATPTTTDDSAIVAFNVAAPAVLANGNLKIEQTDRPTILELPLDVMHNPNVTNSTLDREFKVNNYPLLKAVDDLEITAELPAGLADGVDHYAKIILRGYVIAN